MFQYIILLLVYGLGYALSEKAGLISFIIMFTAGLAFYFYYATRGEKNFFGAKAVFSAAWLITIGAAQLRLLQYQNLWEVTTWINVAVAHLVFLIANDLAVKSFPSWEKRFSLKKIKDSKLPFYFEMKKERLFWVTLITALLGLASFTTNVYIKGYIPFFVISKYPSAYVDFYTRLHIFTVASTLSGSLAFFCLKKLNLSRIKKVFMVLVIAIMVFVLPILMVQRGTFTTAALILAFTVYILSNRKFHVALLCIMIIFGVYILGSTLRGYSDAHLSELFKPKEIVWGTGNNSGFEDPEIGDGEITAKFEIPSKVAFLYSYLTVSHDNFNLLVKENDSFSLGLMQVVPFNVVLRSNILAEMIDTAEKDLSQYRVLNHLNTHNLIAFAYYDFGLIGVILLPFLWSFAFGLIEQFNKKYLGAFGIMTYGVVMTPIMLCFFYPWLSFFSTWLLWGTTFLMFFASSITLKRKEGINA